MNSGKIRDNAAFIWDIANLLRGDYKQSDYGKIILPFTVLRRLDCVLAKTKKDVLAYLPKLKTQKIKNIDPVLNKVAKQNFHNRSKYDFDKLVADPNNIAANLRNYINGFSESGREIIEYFDFDKQIDRLDKANLLYQVVKRFQEVDMHPNKMSNVEAGYIFEELIRKFAELSNETAGEHFTPREVIRLMVNLLFIADKDILTKKGIVKTLYDPAGGTGGMLTVADDYLRELNSDARLELFGQEINPESYAIFKADMLIKGQNATNVKFGNSFTEDGLPDEKFDYMLSNPPFGVSWKKVQKQIEKEHETLGSKGRFGAGLPRINDGSLLFLQHMISKMKNGEQGTRLAIVFNGSPLFTGSAGSGESEIRKWIIENDMLEAIIGLPDQLFYNTGISTYIWIIDNQKRKERKGKIQLIDATSFFEKMTKSLGNKRNHITDTQIEQITQLYGNFKEAKHSKIFDNADFGYSRITVERPEYGKNGKVIKDKKGNPKPDTSLRDSENVPLKENIETYFKREVLPHVPDAWIDHDKTRVGYEINFNRHFYKFSPLRELSEIQHEINEINGQLTALKSTVDFKLKSKGKWKSSGVAWFGEIPIHWAVKRFKNVFTFSRGLSITKEDLLDNGVPCVSYGEIHSKLDIDFDPAVDSLRFVDNAHLLTSPNSLMERGDFVFADTSEDVEGSGNFTFLNSDINAFAGYHTIIAKPAVKFDHKYIAYLLSSLNYRHQIRSEVTGTKVYSITQAILKNTKLILPPQPIQSQIANYLDVKTDEIDKSIELQQKLIDRLQEYRKALINEAVIGRIDIEESYLN